MSFVSYAQNFEDVLLHRVFGGQETGFYVDIGAFHPVIGSVTKAFYDRGWSGINVEPGKVFEILAKERPRDINLKMAVLDRTGDVTFTEDPSDPGTSRVGADPAAAAPLVPCDTLEAIIGAHSRDRPVDFIKIDAEGAEAAIVHSTDWRRLRPRVLLLEATRPWSSVLANEDWEPALLKQGYVRAYFDGINCFYVPEEEAAVLLRYFQVPVNVLDRAERHDDQARHAALQARAIEVAHLTMERDTARAALDGKFAEATRLIGERDDLQAALEIQRAETVRLTALHDLLRATLDYKSAEATRLMEERDRWFAAFETSAADSQRLTAERDAALAAHGSAAQIGDERDALRTALAEKMVEAAQLAEMVRTLEARVAPPSEATQAVTPVTLSRPRVRLRRRAAKAVYRLVRPVVRPVAWRLRTFLTGDLAGQIRGLDARIEAVAHTQAHGAPALAPMQPTIIQMRDDGAAREMRRLASEMERTLLTLALERPPEPWSHPAPAAEPPPSASSASARDRSSHSSPDVRMTAAE
jgi:FkbM family methyltransferase